MKEYSGFVIIGLVSVFNCYILYKTNKMYNKLDRTLDRIIEVKNVIEKNIERQEDIKKLNSRLLSNINNHLTRQTIQYDDHTIIPNKRPRRYSDVNIFDNKSTSEPMRV